MKLKSPSKYLLTLQKKVYYIQTITLEENKKFKRLIVEKTLSLTVEETSKFPAKMTISNICTIVLILKKIIIKNKAEKIQ